MDFALYFKHFGGRYGLLLDNWRCHLKGEQLCLHAENKPLKGFKPSPPQQTAV